MDTNGNGGLSITDVFITYKKVAVAGYTITPPTYRLFTETEWTTVNNSSSNLTTTYPGVNSLTMSNLVSGDSTNVYLIRTGHEN